MKSLPAILLMLTGSWSVARAEPLDVRGVPAEANWLVHIDFDAMKAGKIPGTIGDLWLAVPSAQENLKRWSRAVGMDPAKDLHGITIYGRRYAQPSGVVILRAEVDRERLLVLLRRKSGYRTEPYGGRELITWTENKGKKDEHNVTGCFYRPTVIVVGREAAEVKNALGVLDGTSRGLAEGDPLFTADVPRSTMIQARAAGLADLRLFKSPLVQQSKFLFVAAGERGSEAFGLAKLLTESEEVARRVRAVAEGFLAMAQLQFDSDPEVTKILSAVKVSTDGKTVTVECRGPAEDVAGMIEKVWAKQLKSRRAD